MKLILHFLILTLYSSLNAQLVEGVELTHYPVAVDTSSMKKPIKWNMNPYKSKKKEIREGYEHGVVNFGGHYVAVLWSSQDTVRGVAIDNRSGNIYPLPLSIKTCFNRCQDQDDIFDRYLFDPESKLFVTSTCKIVQQKADKKIEQVFYFYLWNESSKKFTLIKTTKKERQIK